MDIQAIGLQSSDHEELPSEVPAPDSASAMASRGSVCDGWATSDPDGDAQPRHGHVRNEKGSCATNMYCFID